MRNGGLKNNRKSKGNRQYRQALPRAVLASAVNRTEGEMMDFMTTLIRDYNRHKATARYWASVAIQNKRDGMPWEIAASRAHEALHYALMIIA